MTSGRNPEGMQGTGSGVGMGPAPRESSSCRKISKSLVRRDEAEKGESASSKTCGKTMMLLVVRSRHRFSVVSRENTFGGLESHFVSGFGREIGIADTNEHTQVLIGGGDSVEGDVWTCLTD
jgi:hypothetical protein